MDITLLDPQSSAWATELDHFYSQLGGADNATLFPYHFLETTFPRIGGQIAVASEQGVPVAVGFLFPRRLDPQPPDQRAYTLRYHALPCQTPADQMTTSAAFAERLPGLLSCHAVHLYHPEHAQTFAPTHHWIGNVDIGRPDAAEAAQIRNLQQQIWRSAPGSLYPADMHSLDFCLGTSLVVRAEGQLAGFLFGFYKFSDARLPADWTERFHSAGRLESQTLGVLPEYRGLRLGFLLKQVQAENARAQGIHLINWTVDPLQYPNALLNFGLLRAVAFDFTPDYYPSFRNELNRMPASRFSITWLVSTDLVRQRLAEGAQAKVLTLHHYPAIARVNDGCVRIDYSVKAPQIAIEIPLNWTTLQRDDLAQADQWRAATDTLLQHYIGREEGQYVVTNIAVEGERRFLLAERVQDALWEQLGSLKRSTPRV